MKIGYLQFKPELHNTKINCDKVRDFISKPEYDLLVLPELANSGYLFDDIKQVEETSENPETGKFCKMLKKIAKEKFANIVSGFNESVIEGGVKKFYNSSILVFPNGDFRIYRKTHLFYDEKLFFEKGNSGFWVYDILTKNYTNVKIGMMVCFDWLFPESVQTLALRGAQIICHPSNLVMPYCQTAMFTRAIENRVFTITANRIGKDAIGEKSFEFTGGSVIINPKGEYLSRASVDKEELNIVEINPEDGKDKFINPKNNLFDERRPDFYYED